MSSRFNGMFEAVKEEKPTVIKNEKTKPRPPVTTPPPPDAPRRHGERETQKRNGQKQ